MKEFTITIHNLQDYYHFYKMLPFYKFFYGKKNIFINSSINQDELQEVAACFNIKNKSLRKEYVYLHTCDYIDKHYLSKNICQFKNNYCLATHYHKIKRCNGCCGQCRYLKNGACQIKSLGCKLYYCFYLKRNVKTPKLKELTLFKYFYSLKD